MKTRSQASTLPKSTPDIDSQVQPTRVKQVKRQAKRTNAVVQKKNVKKSFPDSIQDAYLNPDSPAYLSAVDEVYKQAILSAKESDIVLSERITGIPVAVINTDYIKRSGLQSGWLARWMLSGNKSKHWMRTIYALKSIWQLKKSSLDESGEREYWQAGKSVAGIESIESCDEIIRYLLPMLIYLNPSMVNLKAMPLWPTNSAVPSISCFRKEPFSMLN